MPSFNYKAIDKLGHTSTGQIDALNEVDLELRLFRMDLDLITFREAKKSTGLFKRNQVSNQDLVMFCFQIEQLSNAGVPLLECLQDLRESSQNPYFQKVLGAVSAEVEGGKTLSQALAAHPNVFSEVFVSLIAAGEQSGQLPLVFNNLFETIRWQDELMSQTKKLLAYPTFVAVVVLGAVAFLMSYLVPQMSTFLHNMGQELPLNTKILIAISDAFVNYWWLFIGLPGFVFISLATFINTNANARYRFDIIKLYMPITGPILHKIIMARFSRYFALMYQAGIPILDAINICEKIVGNHVVADALNRVHKQISAGDAMSESFRNAGLFPQLVVRMIRVGENTGNLDKALLNISYFYDRDVNDAMQKMLKMIEPALTVLLGAILGFIMYSVLGPVYESFSQLKI
jgi:type IV pilus assembly protein PilC